MSRLRIKHLGSVVAVALAFSASWADASPAEASVSPAAFVPPDTEAQMLFEKAITDGAVGIYLDSNTAEFVLVGGPGSSSKLRDVLRNAPGLRSRVEESPLTSSKIGEIQRAMDEHVIDQKQKTGGYSSGFDPALGLFTIKSDLPASAFADVLDQFPGLVSYVEEPMEIVDLSRENDIEAYWGGVRISTEPDEWLLSPCSTGFTVKNAAGTRFMVSASHCAESVGQQLFQPLGKVEGTVAQMTNRAVQHKDILLIGGKQYGTSIYRTADENDTTPTASVVQAADPGVGSFYCFSGARTFNTCSHKVIETGRQVCDGAGICLNNMAVLTGGVVPISGDSGGPVYFFANNSAYIRGTIIRKNNNNGEMYIHVWSTIQQTYQVAIVLAP
jgi:hypothetical protein